MSAEPLIPPGRGYGVNRQLTPNPGSAGRRPRSRRGRDSVENDAYTAFCTRIIRAAGRRIAEGDVEGLRDLLALQQELDQAVTVAVAGLRRDFSWGEIASRLGTSRQNAHQRWGKDIPADGTDSGNPVDAQSPGGEQS
jgi:hypothetical protein